MSHVSSDFLKWVERTPTSKLASTFPAEKRCFKAMHQRTKRQPGTYINDDLQSFRSFLRALGPRPSEDWTVDRIDTGDPEYAANKVRWADKRQQANNRSITTFLTSATGEIRPLSDWAALTGQKASTLRQRLKRRWTHAEIISGKRLRTAPPSSGVGQPDWPDGATPSIWEGSYNSWRKARGGSEPRDTRAVFIGWISANRARHLLSVLNGQEQSNERLIDITEQWQLHDRLHRSSLAMMSLAEREMFMRLRKQAPNVFSPEEAVAKFKKIR